MRCLKLKVTYSIAWTTFCKNYRWAQLFWVCSILFKTKMGLIGLLPLVHVFLGKNSFIRLFTKDNTHRCISSLNMGLEICIFEIFLFCYSFMWNVLRCSGMRQTNFYFCLTRLSNCYAKLPAVHNLIHEYMSKKSQLNAFCKYWKTLLVFASVCSGVF